LRDRPRAVAAIHFNLAGHCEASSRMPRQSIVFMLWIASGFALAMTGYVRHCETRRMRVAAIHALDCFVRHAHARG
jgi:hypothetical protein